MTCPFDTTAQFTIGDLPRPYPLADAARHFLDGSPIRGNRIPQPQEPDIDIGALGILRWSALAEEVSNPPVCKVPIGMKICFAECTIGNLRLCIQFLLRMCCAEPLFEKESDHDSNCERPTAESKSIDRVIPAAIIATGKFVEIDYVSFEAISECTTQNGGGLEGRGPDPVVIKRNLIGARQVEALEDPP